MILQKDDHTNCILSLEKTFHGCDDNVKYDYVIMNIMKTHFLSINSGADHDLAGPV